jgi:hypothetical protein
MAAGVKTGFTENAPSPANPSDTSQTQSGSGWKNPLDGGGTPSSRTRNRLRPRTFSTPAGSCVGVVAGWSGVSIFTSSIISPNQIRNLEGRKQK